MSLRKFLIVIAVSVCAPILPSNADVQTAEFDGIGDFEYQVNFMTDLDQKRNGLLDDGSMFCAPTSAMNLITYAANFGFPEVIPGPGVWEGATNHGVMTIFINLLGFYMGTDAEGTDGSGISNGLNNWLSIYGLPHVRLARDTSVGFWPNIDHAAFQATAGGLPNVSYGRYDYVINPNDGIPWLTLRQQGHVVTLQRTEASNGSSLGAREIRFRNPSRPDDGDLFSNSGFASQVMPNAENINVYWEVEEPLVFELFAVTSLNNPIPDDGRYRIIDAVTALYPPGGSSFTHVEVAAIFSNGKLGFVSGVEPPVIDIPTDTSDEPLLAASLHPELHSTIALIDEGDPSEIKLVQIPRYIADSGNDAIWTDMRPLSLRKKMEESSKFDLELGYGHTVYALVQGQIFRLVALNGKAEVMNSVLLSKDPDGNDTKAAAFHFNPETLSRTLAVWQEEEATGVAALVLLGENLELMGRFERPAQFRRVGNGGEVVDLAISPGPNPLLAVAFEGGGVGIVDMSRDLRRYPNSRTNAFDGWMRIDQLKLDGPPTTRPMQPESVDFDDFGRLYIADRQLGLLELQLTEGEWEVVSRPLYSDFDLRGKAFKVMRSRTNIIPEIHDSDSWNHIPADEVLELGTTVPDSR